MKTSKQAVGTAMVLLVMGSFAFAQGNSRTIRAADLSPQIMSQFDRGEISELTVEFRQGDRLPVTLQAEGDLLETTETNPSYFTVKKAFWAKIEQYGILMSLDGVSFKPFKNVVTGSVAAGASASNPHGVANAINVIFKAVLK